MGIKHDEWQGGLGRAILAKRADGLYACGIGGAFISIPRQTGKTFTIGSIVFALCILHPGLTVLWTAHHGRTSDQTFRTMQGMANRPLVQRHIGDVRRGSGKQAIEFKNGSRILFGARESGFGRGFDDVDIVVFDEAQILTQKALDDMVPATNVAANPLVIFMGTPPTPTDPSEVFTNKRAEALKAKDKDVRDFLYVEIGADPDADIHDRDQWGMANPSFLTGRTREDAMLRLLNLLGEESFKREGLGIWPSAAALERSTISAARFAKCGIKDTTGLDGRVAYGVKFSVDGSRVSLAVALKPDAGMKPHVEVIANRSMSDGTGWLVDWLVPRAEDAIVIVIDGKAHAGSLVNDLLEAGVSERAILTPTTEQVITAHAMFLNAVRSGTMTWFKHKGQAVLRDAVAGAGQRPIGTAGGWGWRPLTDADVGPLEAVTLAEYGAMTVKPRKRRTHDAVFR